MVTDDQLCDLCARVLKSQQEDGHVSFEKACKFIADCADVDFIYVVKICQGVEVTNEN